MKKLLSFLLLGSALFAATPNIKAQSGSAYTFSVVAGDSLVTADSVFKKITLTAGYNALGVQVAIKKATGTLDGKLYLLTSINANNYVLTDSASLTAVPTNAQITNGGYTHTAIINKAAPPGTRYIAYVTQAGSLTASPTLWSFTARK